MRIRHIIEELGGRAYKTYRSTRRTCEPPPEMAGRRSGCRAAGRMMPWRRPFGMAHKCGIAAVDGIPMLQRVLQALTGANMALPVLVSIDDVAAGQTAAGPWRPGPHDRVGAFGAGLCKARRPRNRVLPCPRDNRRPCTADAGDGAHFCARSLESGADFCVGLATAETNSRRLSGHEPHFLQTRYGPVSGCNLFAVSSPMGLALFDTWSAIEKNRRTVEMVASLASAPSSRSWRQAHIGEGV